ncbi:neurensin-1 [Takifugu rubripes]|uniref:Neurensin 1 n=1 Tax=Takifugu rubripes TaxID=31033 RepID=H2T6Z0_TAKRU|nr:neurensin-1 [Takifugu rubripes]XP_029695235.1 neurensin-1 [Takifugu rubripes]|eukprot:XP_003966039.1 PREDICTED: neurensin-1 [Takifugu rubripes]
MTSCCGSEHAEQTQAKGSYQQYGVRSYLHQFYEECTASIWERDEDFQIQRSPSRWSSLLWKVCLVFGTLILLAGLIVVLVGYATPTRIEAFGGEDLLFVDSRAVSFNRALDVCKLTGAVLFCVGGTSMAVGLLLSAFAKSYSKEELYLQQKFKERLADLQATVGTPIMRAPTPGEGKVPATLSRVHNIQPTNTKSET